MLNGSDITYFPFTPTILVTEMFKHNVESRVLSHPSYVFLKRILRLTLYLPPIKLQNQVVKIVTVPGTFHYPGGEYELEKFRLIFSINLLIYNISTLTTVVLQ